MCRSFKTGQCYQVLHYFHSFAISPCVFFLLLILSEISQRTAGTQLFFNVWNVPVMENVWLYFGFLLFITIILVTVDVIIYVYFFYSIRFKLLTYVTLKKKHEYFPSDTVFNLMMIFFSKEIKIIELNAYF